MRCLEMKRKNRKRKEERGLVFGVRFALFKYGPRNDKKRRTRSSHLFQQIKTFNIYLFHVVDNRTLSVQVHFSAFKVGLFRKFLSGRSLNGHGKTTKNNGVR